MCDACLWMCGEGGEGMGREEEIKITLSESNICILLMHSYRPFRTVAMSVLPKENQNVYANWKVPELIHLNKCQNLLRTKKLLEVTWDISLTHLSHECINSSKYSNSLFKKMIKF